MKRLMSTRRTSAPFAENARNQNGTNDNTRIMDADDNNITSAHDHEHAHDNPAHDDDGLAYSYPAKNDNFLNDLQNATSKR